MSEQKIIAVYKCKGYKGYFVSRTWLKEIKSMPNGDERILAQVLRNGEILDTKEEPYYSELMKSAEMTGITDPYELRDILNKLIDLSNTRSWTREDIDKISAQVNINLWEKLYWESRLVSTK